jgi:hypothetical protein
MRISNLLFSAALLITSVGAMAQTVTAGDVRLYPGGKGSLQLNFNVPSSIAGWQMELSLPDGFTVTSTEQELKIGTAAGANANFMDVDLTSNYSGHVVIGGTTTDDNVLLVCFPKVKDGLINVTNGVLCTVNLKAPVDAAMMTSDDAPLEVAIKSIVMSDKDGSKNPPSAPATSCKLRVHPKGDANADWDINVADLQAVLNKMDVKGVTLSDTNMDGEVNVADLQAVLNEM